MLRNEAKDEYEKALKLGQKCARENAVHGKPGTLPVLDQILMHVGVDSQRPIGITEIPLDQVVGTKTEGRTAAFASNFMPMLPPDTEFSDKWINLCMAHLDEGIRDPIRCFEYRNLFYVQEGNKRVSVLKYFGADSISASVIRVVPAYTDDAPTRIYYEFMEFYRLAAIYYLTFSQEGSYDKFQVAIGKKPNQAWTDDDRTNVLSLYNWVRKAYQARGGEDMSATVGDVLLMLLRVYSFEELQKQSPEQLAKSLDSVWDDILALTRQNPVTVSTQPAEPAQATLLDRILPGKRNLPEHLKIAFVNVRTPELSAWTNAHEFGRTQLNEIFGDKVETVAYNGAVQGENDDAMLEKAVAEGADLIFTTSPQLVGASLRAAVRHPKVHILNCSMDMPYASIRTYYSRIYEAKFVTGAIAAAMTENDKIGYVAEYPIFGTPSNINSFALGAAMVNPRARIQLEWSTMDGQPNQRFAENSVKLISGHDTPMPGLPNKEFGVYRIQRGGILQDLASPFWHWGRFYENVVRSILDGSWSRDKSGVDGRAVNYWWGMNSGAIDVLLSRELPHGVRRLANILRDGIISGAIEPFRCHITAQDGSLKNEGARSLSQDEILHMDWLCENVDGFIPEYEQLTERAKAIYRMQGVHRERVPLEKESVL
jgi:basic membrane lipoprotein Med (substrate-binding protein (PBP1-ABC) superfamily)